MVEIAIVEDEHKEAELLKTLLNEYAAAHDCRFSVTHFPDPQEFLSVFRDKYDLVFLDICMPDISGMDVARRLRELDSKVTIVFVTNMIQYAVEGYSVQASDFIVKPAAAASVNRVMNRVISALSQREQKTVTIKNSSDGRTVVVNADDILYVECSGHRITWHTVNGDFVDWGSMNSVIEKLPQKSFARCHVSFLVGLKHVNETRKDTVIVGESSLPVSRMQKNAFFAALAAYLGKSGG